MPFSIRNTIVDEHCCKHDTPFNFSYQTYECVLVRNLENQINTTRLRLEHAFKPLISTYNPPPLITRIERSNLNTTRGLYPKKYGTRNIEFKFNYQLQLYIDKPPGFKTIHENYSKVSFLRSHCLTERLGIQFIIFLTFTALSLPGLA